MSLYISTVFHAQFSGWEVFLKDGWATDTFVTNYLPLALFPILYIGAKFYYKEPIKKPHEMDFITNIQEIEAETYVARSIFAGLVRLLLTFFPSTQI